MTIKAIDCSVRLNSTLAKSLKASGVSAVGRYLGFKTFGWSKSITLDEAKALSDAGLKIFSIYESNPTKASYFSYDAGVRDANIAFSEAEYIKQPIGTSIYFTVDFDAQPSDMPEIQNYFKGIKDTLKNYKVGLYGSYHTCSAIKGVDYYFQTYAWSGGGNFGSRAIYQYHNDVTIDGVACDLDYVYNEAGMWPIEYKLYEVKVNEHPYSAVAVGTDTYVLWTAIKEFGVSYHNNGNGVMVIGGTEVKGVVIDGNTYLPWYDMALPNKVKAVMDNGEWSFTLVTPVQPKSKFFIEIGPFDTKEEATKVTEELKYNSIVSIKEDKS